MSRNCEEFSLLLKSNKGKPTCYGDLFTQFCSKIVVAIARKLEKSKLKGVFKMYRGLLLCLFFVVSTLTVSASALADTIKVIEAVPYQDEKKIQRKVLDECFELGDKLSSFIVKYSTKAGVKVEQVANLPAPESGERVLKVEMTNAISQGNAFLGHAKFVEVEGTLYEGGEKVGSFFGQRSSGGGFFGGYKGSCSVLGRCVKTLGKDIATWLKNPRIDSRIGE